MWSVEEKQRLIDSMVLELPLPLFLVAEIGSAPDSPFELIDGMQRLNAIFSFIEQEFDLDGKYFDLQTLADTKALLDSGVLQQREPLLDRATSVNLANYSLALSVFRASDQGAVDEVFRRINSGGRRLSRHELRQAGTVSGLANLVRQIASVIRTDTTPGDTVSLSKMPLLSISNRNLAYGVPVTDIFWVKENILRRDDVRESLDEQNILDILVDCLVEPMGTTSNENRDRFYNFVDTESGETNEASAVETAIEAYGADEVQKRFLAVYDTIRSVLEHSDETFTRLIGLPASGRGGRYFHALFVALWEAMFKDTPSLVIADPANAVTAFRNISTASSTTSGGDWAATAKRDTINAFKGRIAPAMTVDASGNDLGQLASTSRLETILTNARVEQQPFDCKQGFYTLSPTNREFDDGNFDKILRTLTAMANIGPESTSYLVVGVADDEEDAARVASLDAPTMYKVGNFDVVGIDREATLSGKSLNDYWAWVIQKVKSSAGLDSDFARSLARSARLVPYRQLTVALFKVQSSTKPQFFKGELWDRHGSSTEQVPAGEPQFEVFRRFSS